MAKLSKECGVCLKVKSVKEFSKDNSTVDKLQFRCKQCRKDWYEKHKAHDNLRNNNWYWQNKDKRNEKAKEHYRNNKKMYWDKTDKRSANIQQATIIKTLVMQELLELIHRTKPKGYEMDHIIPLHNKDICGLHVPWNLQYLPAKLNRQKGTKFDYRNPKKYDATNELVNRRIKQLIKEYNEYT